MQECQDRCREPSRRHLRHGFGQSCDRARLRAMLARLETGLSRLRKRGSEWVETRDPRSASGVAIGAWRRYESVDGAQQTALLALYFLIAVVPALLVIEEYLETSPGALANHLVH